MNLVDLVALVALAQYFWFSALVGQARERYGVKAPAVSGHEMFERAYRVQMNTLEQLMLFLPALYLCARYWPPAYAAAAGAVYLVGRIVYWRAYVRDPSQRGTGFALSVVPSVVMVIAALVGVVRTFF